LAVAKIVAKCCISQIFAFGLDVALFNATFLSSLSEYTIIIHCRKLDSLGYISIADSIGLASTTVAQLPPELPNSV